MSFFAKQQDLLKKKYDAIPNTAIRINLLNAPAFCTGVLATGLVAVFYAKLFSWAEQASPYLFHKAGWLFFISTPVCFVRAWWLVKRFAPLPVEAGYPR